MITHVLLIKEAVIITELVSFCCRFGSNFGKFSLLFFSRLLGLQWTLVSLLFPFHPVVFVHHPIEVSRIHEEARIIAEI